MQDELRAIQILNTLFHKSMGTVFGLPAMKLEVTITTLVVIAIGIRGAAVLNPLVIAFLYLGSITGLIIPGIVIPLSAKVFTETTKFCFPNFKLTDTESRALEKKVV